MEENNNTYLIPANSKKSMLILGYFNAVDLVVFIMGIAFSILLLLVVKSTTIWILLLVVTPGLISAFMVMPVPYYHNIMQLLTNIYEYYTTNRKFRWKGWCVINEE